MSKHTKFIETSIVTLVESAAIATKGIGSTIETYPLCDYVMQTLFLKMTGFQEQKLKCIRWDMATNDYEYRYDFLKSPMGECSSLRDKNDIFQELSKRIDNFETLIPPIKSRLITEARNDLNAALDGSNLISWAQQEYNFYETFSRQLDAECLLLKCKDESYKLFMKSDNCKSKNRDCRCLGEIYEDLYKHRNRCAHNLLSYQQNLPTLQTLYSSDYQYNNHFIRLFLLIIIDKLFVESYRIYMDQNS